MNTDASPVILVFLASITLLLVLGWGMISFGKRFESLLKWPAFTAVLLNFFAGTWGVVELFGGSALEWKRNWIYLSQDLGYLGVGVQLDYASMILLGLSWVVTSGFLITLLATSSESRLERTLGGALLSLAGAEVCAIAATPWVALFGLSFGILGGYFGMSVRSSSDAEAKISVRFVWERAGGLALIIAGLCGRTLTAAPELGNWLVLAGFLIQLHPFPLTGWLVGITEGSTMSRAVMGQILPAIATYVMLFRMEPTLHGGIELTVLSWVLLGSVFLNAVSGLTQTSWKSGFSAWTSSVLCLPVIALSLGFQAESLLLLSSIAAGCAAMAFGVTALTYPSKDGNSTKGTWAVVLLVTSTAVATGMPGFGSAGGLAGLWSGKQAYLGELTALIFVVFMVGFTAWKLAWDLFPMKAPLALPWYAVLSPLLLILPSIGVIWSGQASGGLFSEGTDLVWKGLIHLALPNGGLASGSSTDLGIFPVGSIVLVSVFFVQIGLAAWLAPKITAYDRSVESKTLNFVACGYQMDRLGKVLFNGAMTLVGRINELLDQKLWREGAKAGIQFSRLIQNVSKSVHAVDRGIAAGFVAVPRGAARVTGELLQKLLLGDVQAYVLFAIATVFVLLVRVTIQ